ncbi:MAG: EAL and HDOD domain-containing protein [Pseudomonadota bacterium]
MTEQNPSTYCIALQPICDGEMRHRADELLYRGDVTAREARFGSDVTATARVCNTAFYEMGLEALAGDRKLFFNAPREWILKPDLLPPETKSVVVEVLESVDGDPQVIEALQAIRDRGYTIALDDFELTDRTRPLLDVAHIIKVDLLNGINEDHLDVYRDKGIQLLAEKVEDLETFNHCRDKLGFTLFQGFFYSRPEVMAETSRKRSGNKSAQIRLLTALQTPEPDFEELEKLLALDPNLCIQLLRVSNSAAFRRNSEITSLNQAMNLLGVERLRSMVVTLLLANNGPASRMLLPQALTRAAMCRELASIANNVDPHSAFTVGLFSMLDRFLGMPLEALLESVPLDPEIKVAVLELQGSLGTILKLARAHEKGKIQSIPRPMVEKLNQCYLRGRRWTTSMMREAAA